MTFSPFIFISPIRDLNLILSTLTPSLLASLSIVKNSTLGDGTKASHLAYIGDADIGSNVNIGCGVIFVNYDGKNKFRSIVHDNGFVGSNSNIVAPVEIEEYGYVAAGSTITKNVSKFQLSIERSQQKNINDWVKRKGLGGEE